MNAEMRSLPVKKIEAFKCSMCGEGYVNVVACEEIEKLRQAVREMAESLVKCDDEILGCSGHYDRRPARDILKKHAELIAEIKGDGDE
jgi:hypothetical protein